MGVRVPPFAPLVQLTQWSSAYRSGGRGSAPVEAFSWSLFCPNWAGLFLASFDFAGGFGQVRFADDVAAVEDRARFVAADPHGYAFRDAATNHVAKRTPAWREPRDILHQARATL